MRQVIDARSGVSVITTLPPARPVKDSQLVLRQARTSREDSLKAVSAGLSKPRIVVCVSASVLSVAGTGFALGFAGVGERTLLMLAGAFALLCAGVALLSLLSGLVSGGSAPHCPGAWHK